MENSKTSFIDEETFYYSSSSNFGVRSRNLISPRNIKMSYSHLSSNNKISFSNTIMIPYIEEEKKNEDIKDSQRTKTESTKEEKNNTRDENVIPKIIIHHEDEKIDEATNADDLINIITIEFEEQKTVLENNPFFLGIKSTLNVNANPKDSINEVEMKKVKTLLRQKSKKAINKEDKNLYLKTSKNIRKKSNIENIKNKSSKKVKRMGSLNLKSSKEDNNKKEERKDRKSKTKYRTSHNKDNKLLAINSDENKIPKLSDKTLNLKKNKDSPLRKKRKISVGSNSPNTKNKDKNNCLYKSSLFSKHSSRNVIPKLDTFQLNKDKIVKIKNNDINKETRKNSKFISNSTIKNLNTKNDDFNFFEVAKNKKVKTKDYTLTENKKK